MLKFGILEKFFKKCGSRETTEIYTKLIPVELRKMYDKGNRLALVSKNCDQIPNSYILNNIFVGYTMAAAIGEFVSSACIYSKGLIPFSFAVCVSDAITS